MGKKRRQIWLIVVLSACVSGCVGRDLRELRQAAPSDDAFFAILSRGYLQMAEEQSRNYDWVAASLFAQKGLAAAYGQIPAPEDASQWDVPEPSLAPLKQAQAALEKRLGETPTPSVLATAQLQYDCWVDAEEDTNREDLATSCKEGFEAAMKQVGGEASARNEDAVAEIEPDEEGAAIASSQETSQSFYLVHFDWNDAHLSAPAKQVLADVAKEIRQLPKGHTYQLILNGHTDRSGKEQFNYQLSQMRALAVQQALVRAGLDDRRIEIFAFGDTDPKVPTEQGVREPANRRVEIMIQ